MKACLIGKTLKHSFSKEIHIALGVDYDLVELAEGEVETFVKGQSYSFYNVTIPYKETVIPFLDEIDESAKAVGAVNTVKTVNGKTVGYNTDVAGMEYALNQGGAHVSGANCVILGTGGTAKTARATLTMMGAKKITTVSRTGQFNYENYHLLTDTEVLINTTPVGMFPNVEARPVDLVKFPNLKFVFDAVYNPLKTELYLQAESLGIPARCGLSMLVYQAVRAEEIWQGKSYPVKRAQEIVDSVFAKKENVTLIGMPAAGKTTVGQKLANLLSKPFVDLDLEIERQEKMTISEIFATKGETYFRDIETSLIKEFGNRNGIVLSTGGGAPVREENRNALRRNSFVVWIDRKIEKLTTNGRPVSQREGVERLYEQRSPIYQSVADVKVDNNGNLEETLKEILELYEENLGN
ncbi:MAG: hypothetical protein E7363_03790 [Clostridiales bacterium]|nr:hypothetical protein [Clostridiales bacterium]